LDMLAEIRNQMAPQMPGVVQHASAAVWSDEAHVAAIRQAYRHYRMDPDGPVARDFAARFCHDAAPIALVGVFDTVKALGLRLPLLWLLTDRRNAFHSTQLGRSIRRGAQA
ncbi:MAG: DUF2235 domain-containing protein, partial [Pseudomonadota bacterium]